MFSASPSWFLRLPDDDALYKRNTYFTYGIKNLLRLNMRQRLRLQKKIRKITHCGSRFPKFGHFTSLGSLSKPPRRRERECVSVLVYRFTRKLPLFFLLFRSHWLAVVYCLVYCIGYFLVFSCAIERRRCIYSFCMFFRVIDLRNG